MWFSVNARPLLLHLRYLKNNMNFFAMTATSAVPSTSYSQLFSAVEIVGFRANRLTTPAPVANLPV